MCGIIGYVGRPLPDALPLARLAHRGPDQTGTWTNGRDVRLGHTRLSILDLDPRAGQPMLGRGGRLALVFNGEIYNYLELRQRFCPGEDFQTGSDTEVLLRLWERLGPGCLAHLRGMFAFAVWDEDEQALWLARDRLGKKPLCYARLPGGGLAFASELPALTDLLPERPTIDPAAMDLFLAYQFIPAPATIYREARKLPPACAARFRPDGDWRLEPYWRLDHQPDRSLTEAEALARLEEKVAESVRLRLRSDVPVGALLSGGVDSSLVTALAARDYGPGFKTFSVGFENGQGELPQAELVARCCRTDHHALILTEEKAASLFDVMLDAYGEPYGDSSALPSLFVCAEAARSVKVALNGDGGDELLAGYGTYRLRPLRAWLARFGRLGFRAGHALEQAAQAVTGDPTLLRGVERLASALSPYAKILRQAQYVGSGMRRALYRPEVFARLSDARRRHETALLEAQPLPADPLNALLSLDCRHFLAHDLLPKMDIAAMASSLEARSPLLDHELFELCATFPPDLKMRRGEGKHLLKTLAARHVPPEVIYRPKRGFSAPTGDWTRGRFAPRFQAMLDDPGHPLWDWLARPFVSRLFREHAAGSRNHSQRIWLLLILGAWLERHAA